MKTSSSVGRVSDQSSGGLRYGCDRRLQRRPVAAGYVKGRPERRRHLHPRLAAQLGRQPVGARPLGLEGDQARRLDHLVRRAARQRPAAGDISDLVTALGLVHVVGRDQHGHALARQRVDLVPEGAPRLGVDPRRRLVQQQQVRRVQGRRRQRQPLLPPARQIAGQLRPPLDQPQPFQRRLDPLLRRSSSCTRAVKVRFCSIDRSS